MDATRALENAQQKRILDTIDSLRSHGLDGILSLPQLVVCGDQSSGKSSLLEAIAEIPFPRKENLCTRFATEVILRKALTPSISCRLKPDEHRSLEQQAHISKARLPIDSIDQLPSIISKVTNILGLDDESTGRRAFAKDILSIEIAGPDNPQLTLVDLPGLIHAENKSQNKEDIEVVSLLVNDYLQNKRTIILPIVSARNDLANQEILTRARNFDSNGDRTLGIITKPDQLCRGSENEKAFLALAKNEDVFFALGWHVVKNRSFDEMHQTFQQRNDAERNFFEKGCWQELLPSSFGIESLRIRLSDLLFQHIKGELPALRKELQEMYNATYQKLRQLGQSRATVSEMRAFLQLSTDFRDIAKAAVAGHYEDAYFARNNLGGPEQVHQDGRRLCAKVQEAAIEFAKILRKHGQKHQINSRKGKAPALQSVPIGSTHVSLKQNTFTEQMALKWVQNAMKTNRGQELPGNFNPQLVGELFHIQSQNWNGIASAHLNHVVRMVKNFCDELLHHLCPRDLAEGRLATLIQDRLSIRARAAGKELEQLHADLLGAPTTYNHYYTMTIRKIRKRKLNLAISVPPTKRKRQSTVTIEKSPPGGFGSSPFFGSISSNGGFSNTSSKVINPPSSKSSFGQNNANGNTTQAITPTPMPTGDVVFDDDSTSDDDLTDPIHPELDMDAHSASDAIDSLSAYYKVALKTFTDNVSVQVVNRHVLRGLEEVFSPMAVAGWDDETVRRAGMESARVSEERARLQGKLEKLKAGMEVFERAID